MACEHKFEDRGCLFIAIWSTTRMNDDPILTMNKNAAIGYLTIDGAVTQVGSGYNRASLFT